MSIALAIAIYAICWWIVLFAILPLKMGAKPARPWKRPLCRSCRRSKHAKTEAQVSCDNDCFGGDRRRDLRSFRLRADQARQPSLIRRTA